MQTFTGRFRATRSQPHRIALVIGVVALVALAGAAYLWSERSSSEQTTGSAAVTSSDVGAYHVPSAGEGLVGGLGNPPVAALKARHASGAGEGFIGGFNAPVDDVVKAHYSEGAGEGRLGGFGQ